MIPNPLTISGLTVGYTKNNLLENVDLEVHEKEFITIMGENGAGKSTLIHTLLGQIPYQGEISFWGESLKACDRIWLNQKVGWVLSVQELIPPNLTIGKYFDSLRNLFDKWDCKQEERLLARFNLSLDKKLNELSSGEFSKFKLVKALCPTPDLLILDELTANLSADSKKVIVEELLGIFNDRHLSVLYISHSSDEASLLSDRVLLIKDKKIQVKE